MLQDASSVIQNEMDSKVNVQTCCNYHLQNSAIPCNWKGLSSRCRRCQAKWEVLSPRRRWHCRMLKILHIPLETLFFVSVFFRPWLLCQFSLFLALQSFNWGLVDFMALLVFTATKTTSIRKPQTLPTPKQKTMPSAVVGVFLQVHQPTTKKTTTNNQQRLADSMPNARFQLQNAAKSKQNGRFQLQNCYK